MAAKAPTVGQIQSAKSKAVGGLPKRCNKGKKCSATCIAGDEACLVNLPDSAGVATSRAAKMVMSQDKAAIRKAGSALLDQMRAENKAAAAPTPQPAPTSRTEAQKAAAEAKQARKQEAVDKAAKKSGDALWTGEKNKGPEPPNLQPLRSATPTTPSPAGQEWYGKYSGRSEALTAQLNELRTKINALPPEQQAYWNEQINKQLNPKLASSRSGAPYPPEKIDKSLASQVKAWNYLVEKGPPKELMDRKGDKRPAPKGMTPDVSPSGQRKWIAPDDGLKYSLRKGEWRQNRVSKADTDRRLPDITNFRREQKATGAEWPTQNLPPREKLKSVDEIIKGLTSEQKRDIVFNGLDATGNEGVKLRAYYNANPEEKDARLREVVQRWHDQGGRSGVSGKPVALPGLDPKPGEERSSVDHFQPISTNRAASLPASEMRRIADNHKNFLIAEEGPNSQRGAGDWGDWLDKREAQAAKSAK